MLIQDPQINANVDPILASIAAIHGGKAEAVELQKGFYEIGHFGSSHWPVGYERSPKFDDLPTDPERVVGSPGPDGMWDYEYEESRYRGEYGVADSVEQILARYPELEAPGREFIVTLSVVRREHQSSDGGWRWHKWGQYIGTQKPQHEYLYYDKHIDQVYCFHIYEKLTPAQQIAKAAEDISDRCRWAYRDSLKTFRGDPPRAVDSAMVELMRKNLHNFLERRAFDRGEVKWKHEVICDARNNTPMTLDSNELHVDFILRFDDGVVYMYHLDQNGLKVI